MKKLLIGFIVFSLVLFILPGVASAESALLANVNTSGRPDLVGSITTDGTSIIFNVRAVGQADDGDDVNTSKYYNQTQFDNEYFTIAAAGKFLKYNMFSGNTTPYWGTSWSNATSLLPSGVTFSQVEDGDDFVYAVSMSYEVLGIGEGDTFSVQIKARDFNDDYVQSYSGYEGNDGEDSSYNGLYITDTGVFDVTVVVAEEPEEEAEEEEIEKQKPKPIPIDKLPVGRYEATNFGFTTLFYNRLLQRPPEQDGLDVWIERLESGEITGADLVKSFIFGEECQARISEYTNEEFITFLYWALFNRAPEEYGFNAWLERMAATMTREEVVDRFTQSEEFINMCKLFGITPYAGYTENNE
jgi:hypothetical protein